MSKDSGLTVVTETLDSRTPATQLHQALWDIYISVSCFQGLKKNEEKRIAEAPQNSVLILETNMDGGPGQWMSIILNKLQYPIVEGPFLLFCPKDRNLEVSDLCND